MSQFEEALTYLQRYTNFETKRTAPPAPGTFELARVHELLRRLGDPHRAYPTIHIAGSKGKGSTTAMIASVLRAAGFKVGMYISPHLHTICERVQIDGASISREDFSALVWEIAPHAEAVEGITWFEFTTALAFLHLARQQVDIAAIEVGLGGRLDATNVIVPEVSVITSLSYEHTAWLGDTLAQIAREKGGIIKQGIPVVCAPQAEEALSVIQAICQERSAPLVLVGRDWLFRPGAIYPDGQEFEARPMTSTAWAPADWLRLRIPLLGRHQVINATCALAAVSALPQERFHIPPEAVRQGLERVAWPGRIEVLSRSPLVIADGAHNDDSARRLRETLEEWFPGRDWTLVIGMLADKDHAAFMRELAPLATHLIVTRSRHPRATDPAHLKEIACALGVRAEIAPNVGAALELALSLGDAVCFTGSLSIAAEAREAWLARAGQPVPETDPPLHERARPPFHAT